MKKIALSLTILLGTLSASNATAFDGDVNAGKEKSATCAACHGPDGNAPVTIYPKIAGQHADYIYKQLQEFKLGMTSGGKEGLQDKCLLYLKSVILCEILILLEVTLAENIL